MARFAPTLLARTTDLQYTEIIQPRLPVHMMGAARPTMTEPKYNAQVMGFKKLMMKRKYPMPPRNMDHLGPIRATTGGENLNKFESHLRAKSVVFLFSPKYCMTTLDKPHQLNTENTI